jgi:hypothetical protein
MLLRPEHFVMMAEQSPDTLGNFVTALAVPLETEVTSPRFDVGLGWRTCDPGKVAARERPGADMQGYIDESAAIILTCVDDGSGGVEFFAEGHGWAIHAEHIYAGWISLPAA